MLAAISPAWLVLVHDATWLPDGARLWLPTYLVWFLGGMLLAVLQAMRMQAFAVVCLPLALVCYLIASTPIAGEPTTSPHALRDALFKTAFYAVISTLVVAPLALGNRGWYSRVLASRPMVFLGEISYSVYLNHVCLIAIFDFFWGRIALRLVGGRSTPPSATNRAWMA